MTNDPRSPKPRTSKSERNPKSEPRSAGARFRKLADETALRPKSQRNQNLTWEETAKAMAAAKEDWSDWECTAADGLNEL